MRVARWESFAGFAFVGLEPAVHILIKLGFRVGLDFLHEREASYRLNISQIDKN